MVAPSTRKAPRGGGPGPCGRPADHCGRCGRRGRGSGQAAQNSANCSRRGRQADRLAVRPSRGGPPWWKVLLFTVSVQEAGAGQAGRVPQRPGLFGVAGGRRKAGVRAVQVGDADGGPVGGAADAPQVPGRGAHPVSATASSNQRRAVATAHSWAHSWVRSWARSWVRSWVRSWARSMSRRTVAWPRAHNTTSDVCGRKAKSHAEQRSLLARLDLLDRLSQPVSRRAVAASTRSSRRPRSMRSASGCRPSPKVDPSDARTPPRSRCAPVHADHAPATLPGGTRPAAGRPSTTVRPDGGRRRTRFRACSPTVSPVSEQV